MVLGPHMTAIPGTTNVFDAFACGRNEGRRERENLKEEIGRLRADLKRTAADVLYWNKEATRVSAELARMHAYILDNEEVRRKYWDIAHERGKEIERLRSIIQRYEP